MAPTNRPLKNLLFLFLLIIIAIVSLYSTYVIFRNQPKTLENNVGEQLPDSKNDLRSLIEEKIQIYSFNEYLWPMIFKPEDVACKAYTEVNYNLSDIEFVLNIARRDYINSWKLAWENRDVTAIFLLSDMYISFREVKFGLAALKVNDANKIIESYTYGCMIIYRLENLEEYRQEIESIIGRPSLSFNYFEDVMDKFAGKVEDEDVLLNFKESSLNYIYLLSIEFDNISNIKAFPKCNLESTLEKVRDFINSIDEDPYLKAIYYDLIYYVFHVLLVDKYFSTSDAELIQRYLCYLLQNFEDVFGIELYVIE